MSIQEALAFQRQQELLASLAAQVEELVEAMAAVTGRLDKLEAAGCAIQARRSTDAERQRRRRSRERHGGPVERDCSAEMP